MGAGEIPISPGLRASVRVKTRAGAARIRPVSLPGGTPEADVAQLVEQRIRNAQVSGSNPLTSSTLLFAEGVRPRGRRREGLLMRAKEDR